MAIFSLEGKVALVTVLLTELVSLLLTAYRKSRSNSCIQRYPKQEFVIKGICRLSAAQKVIKAFTVIVV